MKEEEIIIIISTDHHCTYHNDVVFHKENFSENIKFKKTKIFLVLTDQF
jgi:hypothetical protein